MASLESAAVRGGEHRLLKELRDRRAGRDLWIHAYPVSDRLGMVFWKPGPRRLEESVAGFGPYPRPSLYGHPAAWAWERQAAFRGFWEADEEPLEVLGDGVHRVPLGPVRSDAGESIRYDMSVVGDDIHHVGLRAGYKSRDVASLMSQRPVGEALAVAERVTGTSPVAHALAFSEAVESCRGETVGLEAQQLRALLAELERLMSHLGDLAVLAAATGTVTAAADLYRLKERVLRFNFKWTGHRYLRGVVAPGGVRQVLSLPASGLEELGRDVEREFTSIRRQLDRTNSFLDRLHGAGKIPDDLIGQLGPTGFVGKSAGLALDWRWARPYAGYGDAIWATSPAVIHQADSFGRYWVRAEEVLQSLWLIRRLGSCQSEVLPSTPEPSWEAGPGYGVVEAPRGSLIYRVTMRDAHTTNHVSLTTPSQRNWPVVPRAMEAGNILQDFPIIDASFSLAVSALDL